MQHIQLSDRASDLFQQRIKALKWILQEGQQQFDAQRVINSGLAELPETWEQHTAQHEEFLRLATAVACQENFGPLINLCYSRWKGHPARWPNLISRDPEIRELLSPTGFHHPPVLQLWLRQDWQRFKCWLWRIATPFNR